MYHHNSMLNVGYGRMRSRKKVIRFLSGVLLVSCFSLSVLRADDFPEEVCSLISKIEKVDFSSERDFTRLDISDMHYFEQLALLDCVDGLAEKWEECTILSKNILKSLIDTCHKGEEKDKEIASYLKNAIDGLYKYSATILNEENRKVEVYPYRAIIVRLVYALKGGSVSSKLSTLIKELLSVRLSLELQAQEGELIKKEGLATFVKILCGIAKQGGFSGTSLSLVAFGKFFPQEEGQESFDIGDADFEKLCDQAGLKNDSEETVEESKSRGWGNCFKWGLGGLLGLGALVLGKKHLVDPAVRAREVVDGAKGIVDKLSDLDSGEMVETAVKSVLEAPEEQRAKLVGAVVGQMKANGKEFGVKQLANGFSNLPSETQQSLVKNVLKSIGLSGKIKDLCSSEKIEEIKKALRLVSQFSDFKANVGAGVRKTGRFLGGAWNAMKGFVVGKSNVESVEMNEMTVDSVPSGDTSDGTYVELDDTPGGTYVALDEQSSGTDVVQNESAVSVAVLPEGAAVAPEQRGSNLSRLPVAVAAASGDDHQVVRQKKSVRFTNVDEVKKFNPASPMTSVNKKVSERVRVAGQKLDPLGGGVVVADDVDVLVKRSVQQENVPARKNIGSPCVPDEQLNVDQQFSSDANQVVENKESALGWLFSRAFNVVKRGLGDVLTTLAASSVDGDDSNIGI